MWRARLDRPATDVHRLREILSRDERERADRFHFERDVRRYVVARGVLRRLLGEYLGIEAPEVPLAYGPNGKPEVPSAELHFNVSHAGELALCAFVLAREVGVDIEQVRAMQDMHRIARRFFSDWEARTLEGLPVAEQTEAFFNCWTRKEAYVKARGGGLSLPLDAFDVTLVPGDSARILRADDPLEVERWSLRSLEPGADYVAAVAVEGVIASLRCWSWTR